MAAAITLSVRVHDEQVIAALRVVKAGIRHDVKDILLRGANEYAVPRARQLAPSFAKAHIVASATTTQAYLTLRPGLKRWERARDAYLEFGGTSRAPIHPKKKRVRAARREGGHAPALRLRNGVFVAAVHKPRTIRGKHYMDRGAKAAKPLLIAKLEREVPALIQQRINQA